MIGANGGPVPDAGYLLRPGPNVPERGLFAVTISPPRPRQTLPRVHWVHANRTFKTPTAYRFSARAPPGLNLPAQKVVPAVDVAVRGCRFL